MNLSFSSFRCLSVIMQLVQITIHLNLTVCKFVNGVLVFKSAVGNFKNFLG